MAEERLTFTDGEAYERVIGRWSRIVAQSFLEWLAKPPGLRWLDVGCGSGAFAEEVLTDSHPSAVFGVDPSEEQLRFARSRSKLRGANYQVGVAERLPFDDASFDAAVMALVIILVPNQAQGVAEMCRVVRPGGCVAAYIWDIAGGGVPTEPTLAAMRSLGISYPDLGNPSCDYLHELWQQAGLTEIETRVIRVPITFAGVNEYWAANSVPGGPMHKQIAKLSPSEQDQLRARIGELIPRDSKGNIAYFAQANAVKGRVAG